MTCSLCRANRGCRNPEHSEGTFLQHERCYAPDCCSRHRRGFSCMFGPTSIRGGDEANDQGAAVAAAATLFSTSKESATLFISSVSSSCHVFVLLCGPVYFDNNDKWLGCLGDDLCRGNIKPYTNERVANERVVIVIKTS